MKWMKLDTKIGILGPVLLLFLKTIIVFEIILVFSKNCYCYVNIVIFLYFSEHKKKKGNEICSLCFSYFSEQKQNF